jgi:single-strand DNA-binding protein
MDMNKIFLVGHVGSEPRLKEVNDGNKLVNISLATNEYYKDKAGDKIAKTEWHRLVLWGAKAGYADNHISKGMRISVIGKIQSSNYEKDGKPCWITNIKVDEVKILGSKIK